MGYGANIRIWDDSWLPGHGSHVVPTPTERLNPSLGVCDLICFEMGRWRTQMLVKNFVATKQRVIQDIGVTMCCIGGLTKTASIRSDQGIGWQEGGTFAHGRHKMVLRI